MITQRGRQVNDKSMTLVPNIKMNSGHIPPTTVWRTMSKRRYTVPTVHFFGWDQERKTLTDNLGQPDGDSILEMTLDSMRHAMICNQSIYDRYTIKAQIPAAWQEYVMILSLKGIVFVTRYSATWFAHIKADALYADMSKLAGLLGAKLDEINRKNSYDYSTPEDTKLIIYHPEFQPGSKGPVLHYPMYTLENEFKRSRIELIVC
jgi:hypothetical protein